MPQREHSQIGAETREWIVGTGEFPLLGALGIELTGWSEAKVGFSFTRLTPAIGQLLVTIAGEGEVWSDDGWRRVVAGDVYVSPPGALSAYRAVAGSVWTVGWVHCRADTIAFPLPVSHLLSADPQTLFIRIQGLYAELQGTGDADAAGHWAHLLLLAMRRLTGVLKGDPRLRVLWGTVQADLAHPWNREVLGQLIGLSGEQLRRLCQDAVGCGPMAYVTRLRMQYAASLLSSGRYTVAEVAARVGYDNPFAFSTAFKRELGQPPSQYRHKT